MGPRFSAFCLLIALYLGALEVALEIRAHLRGFDTLLIPIAASSQSTQDRERTRFGPSEGFPFRSPIVPAERPPNTRRYWIASSSHAEDTRQPPERIFPNLLQQDLRARGEAAEVLNASRAGTGIDGNLEQLTQLAPRWQPDVVILYQGSLEINRLSTRYLAGSDRVEPSSGTSANGGRPNPVVRLLESTTLYSLLKTNVTTRISVARPLAPSLTPEAFHDFEGTLRRFVRGVRTRDTVPVLCTFAAMHDRGDLPDFSENAVSSIFRYNPHLSLEGWIDAIERINSIIRQVGAEEQVMVVDVDRHVGGRPDLFVDFVHFTAEGHEAVARAIATGLTGNTGG
jgi:hypothetical protein